MDSTWAPFVDSPHIPVMLREVLAALAPVAGETYIDGTLGAGGYTRAILGAAACNVVAIDRDETAHHAAKEWAGNYGPRLVLVRNTFGNVRDCVTEQANGFVLDIGVSSMQIDQAARGFSFRFDGPLDMRMDQGSGDSAEDIINTMDETDLANLIYTYGEERQSRRIAHAIVEARKQTRIISTGQLASIIRSTVPRKNKDDIDPATRTFQALRIAVNDELGELERALAASEHVLAEGGRLVVVTFHSLEDRIVKNFMKERSGDVPSPSRHLPVLAGAENAPTFRLQNRKPVEAQDDEVSINPRSRSARLRCAIRTAAPPRAASDHHKRKGRS